MDDIFKLPALPKNASKHKLEAPVMDVSSYKSVKLDGETSASSNGQDKGKGRATIEDASDDEDGPAGNSEDFAPGGDADYFEEEDEDGRFFGGGLNAVQKQVLNMMEGGEATEPGELTPVTVRRQLLALEKAIDENRRLRTKFPTDPTKFVDSEFTLLEALHALLLLSSAPALTYPILLDLSTPESLGDLLSHENTDVFIAVVELLEEWLDPEGLDDEDDDEGAEEGAQEKKVEATKALVDGLVTVGVVDLAVGGLDRLNEEEEEGRGGVFHTLGLLENLLTLTPTVATPLLAPTSPFLKYLVTRLAADKLPADRDQNRYYAAEMLSLVLSLPADGVEEGRKRLADESHVDTLLKVLSAYRRRDPSGADETEFMENVFDALCTSLHTPAVKTAFLEGEGIELMCLMLKEKKLSRTRAIKTLDHALQGQSGIALCEKFVELLGLKTLFSAFMGKSANKKSKASFSTATTHEDTEHLLSLLSSLLTSLSSDSPPRLRLLAKFVENDYEKVDRLIELREEVETRVEKAARETVAEEGEDVDEVDIYLGKLEGGLASLQLIDYVTAWICMEDDGVRDHIIMLLARKDRSLSDVIRVLAEYRDNIGDASEEPAVPVGEGAEMPVDEGTEKKEILGHLIEYLKSVD
ncbi:Catenin-beta-like protein [Leucosporidium creatinivorum]|uniref:Catenin-beta-like protein n=1 Tax=Leucosporidium creatinivorum TaxID=106004 RepID=A0A1Y2FCT8_9BASI|nr:Catenin-beta-like protein [Leucosporidium creatinivorum]